MNLTNLNGALVNVIQKRQDLSQLTYDDSRYDEVEEQLHDLEDALNEEYGDYLEEALDAVHRKLRSDTDVLLPTAYLPNTVSGEAGAKEGVWIDSENFPGKKVHLVLVPNPTRLVVVVGKERQEVWKHEPHPAH